MLDAIFGIASFPGLVLIVFVVAGFVLHKSVKEKKDE